MNATTFTATPTMQAHAPSKTFVDAADALRFAENAARQHGVAYAVWQRWPRPRLLRTFNAVASELRLLIAQLAGSAHRHAQWGGLTCAEKAAGAAELREIAGDRPDLLVKTSGLSLGTSEDKRAEFEARGQAIAELCRMAGADEDLTARWIEEGRCPGTRQSREMGL